MNERNNGRGIFYGVIGVATLVVAIIGATFAYFTATASNNVITGNMATVSLNLAVTKVTNTDVTKGGMIPMSNSMVEPAVADAENQVCVDDNGNAVCQVYEIVLTNDSSAGQFVDGYVALKGGSGYEPTDIKDMVIGKDAEQRDVEYEYVTNALFDAAGVANRGTTMRWAQVFKNTGGSYKDASGVSQTETSYTTSGDQVLGTASEKVAIALVDNPSVATDASAHNVVNIRTNNTLYKYWLNDNGTPDDEEDDNYYTSGDDKGILQPLTIAGTSYNVIGTNFIRTSNHSWGDGTKAETYDRTADATSALVFNHSIPAGGSATYYVVVWLSETGTNQTPAKPIDAAGTYTNPAAANFFVGDVTFVSAQGSEVSATFSGFNRVDSQS